MPAYRRRLAERFTLTRVARKVVGVGSVGTETWILLMEPDVGFEPLLLQAKQAQRSVLADYAGPSEYRNHLADFSRTALFPLALPLPAEEVAGTLAGRAFTTGQPVAGSQEQDGQRVWVPVLDQTACTGVLAPTVPHATEETLAQAELLGVFAGLVPAAAARVSDIPGLRRRGRPMSLPAGMQWDLLPPPSARTDGAVIAGILEPAYDIAGDAFDYAVNDGDLHFAVLDGTGTASPPRC